MGVFSGYYDRLAYDLLHHSHRVDVGEWHAQDVSDQPLLITHECRNVVIEYRVPHFMTTLQEDVYDSLSGQHLRFAEAQFQDRVSGIPYNPPPSASLWPYSNEGHKAHLEAAGGKFSHTYPERFWPAFAGEAYAEMKDSISVAWEPHRGIRYDYGDLDDVVKMLAESPYTRQAYLPVWFPEDTGNRGVRLPCSLGYHFMLREGKLNMTYFIRSVDFVRHFADDFYMAARLLQWVLDRLRPSAAAVGADEVSDKEYVWFNVAPGDLTMHIISLHCMEGDLPMMRRKLNDSHK